MREIALFRRPPKRRLQQLDIVIARRGGEALRSQPRHERLEVVFRDSPERFVAELRSIGEGERCDLGKVVFIVLPTLVPFAQLRHTFDEYLGELRKRDDVGRGRWRLYWRRLGTSPKRPCADCRAPAIRKGLRVRLPLDVLAGFRVDRKAVTRPALRLVVEMPGVRALRPAPPAAGADLSQTVILFPHVQPFSGEERTPTRSK